MELDFIGTSDNVVVSTVREVEVSVHQGPAGGTSTISVMEQDPTMNTMVLALQCATVLMCAPSVPHCIVRCPYKCSLADACSRHIFATRNSSTNHNSGGGFPGNGQCIHGSSCLALFMPSYLPRPQMEQSSAQAERYATSGIGG